MQVEQFISSRRERWEALEALVKRAKSGGLRGFSGDDLLRLGRLYRETTSDLGMARRDFPRERVTAYLNDLLARAHPVIYRERAMDLGRIGRFFTHTFPATYRAVAPYTLVAFMLFTLAGLLSAGLVVANQANADLLLPGEAQDLRSIMEQHHLWMKSATENHSVAANFIMLNNIRVAFVAFAGGVTVGLLTMYVEILNGQNLGGIGAMVAYYGLSGQFWSFVVPHGVIELSVIFMSGGAGLCMGDAILRPGLRRRRDAFFLAARQAVILVVGAIPLLIVAGTIEGFLSPSDAPDGIKYAVGIVTGALLYGYLLLSGRELSSPTTVPGP